MQQIAYTCCSNRKKNEQIGGTDAYTLKSTRILLSPLR